MYTFLETPDESVGQFPALDLSHVPIEQRGSNRLVKDLVTIFTARETALRNGDQISSYTTPIRLTTRELVRRVRLAEHSADPLDQSMGQTFTPWLDERLRLATERRDLLEIEVYANVRDHYETRVWQSPQTLK